VRHGSSCVAAASLILLGAAAAIHFSAVSCFLRVFYLPKLEADRWLFLIGIAVPEGMKAPRRHADPRNFQFSPAPISAESPPVMRVFCSKLRSLHRGTSLVRLRVKLIIIYKTVPETKKTFGTFRTRQLGCMFRAMGLKI
jgi:hypothetical protein